MVDNGWVWLFGWIFVFALPALIYWALWVAARWVGDKIGNERFDKWLFRFIIALIIFGAGYVTMNRLLNDHQSPTQHVGGKS